MGRNVDDLANSSCSCKQENPKPYYDIYEGMTRKCVMFFFLLFSFFFIRRKGREWKEDEGERGVSEEEKDNKSLFKNY